MPEEIKVMEEKRELAVPPDVEANGGAEILRLFVTGGALSLTMQRGFATPRVWGEVLAELARHVSTVYGRETPIAAQTAMSEIREALDTALDRIAGGSSAMN
jgi:hypothetical protein